MFLYNLFMAASNDSGCLIPMMDNDARPTISQGVGQCRLPSN